MATSPIQNLQSLAPKASLFWPEQTLKWCSRSLADLSQPSTQSRLPFLMEMAVKIAKAALAVLLYVPVYTIQKAGQKLGLSPKISNLTPLTRPADSEESSSQSPTPKLPLKKTSLSRESSVDSSNIESTTISSHPSSPQSMQTDEDYPLDGVLVFSPTRGSPAHPMSIDSESVEDSPRSSPSDLMPRLEGTMSRATEGAEAEDLETEISGARDLPTPTGLPESASVRVPEFQAAPANFSLWHRVPVDAGGNCLYHSIIHHLERLPRAHLEAAGFVQVPNHIQLRVLCIAYLTPYIEEPDVSAHIAHAMESYNNAKRDNLQRELASLLEMRSLDALLDVAARTNLSQQIADVSRQLDEETYKITSKQAYLEAAIQDRFYAGSPETYAAAKIFNISIHIVREFTAGVFSPGFDLPFVGRDEHALPVYLVNGAKHFDPLLPPGSL